MSNVQNNFNSKNNGNFDDRKIDNTPMKDPVDKMLSTWANQDGTGIRAVAGFNSKVITQ